MTNQPPAVSKTVPTTPNIELFYAEDGTIPFWDHPNFYNRIVPPDDYQPITRVEQTIEYFNRRILSNDDLLVLEVVGAALCANESHIKRYMKKYNEKFGTSHTSRILRKLAKYGLVERHVCRLSFIEDEGEQPKRPSPFTLGLGGIMYLKHYHNDLPVVQPDVWRNSVYGVQRYVALNEIRCLAANSNCLENWLWGPRIGGNAVYRKPLAVAVIKLPEQNQLHLILERAQSSQHYLEHLRTRLAVYREIYDKEKCIWVDGLNRKTTQVVIISVSTVSMAKRLHEQLRLLTYPFTIWFCVDEYLEKDSSLRDAFLQPLENKELKRISLSIFD